MVSYTQEGKKKERMSIEVTFGMPGSGLAFYILYAIIQTVCVSNHLWDGCVLAEEACGSVQLDEQVWEDQGSSVDLLAFCLVQSRCSVSTPRTHRHTHSSSFPREVGSPTPELGSFNRKAPVAFWVTHLRLDWGRSRCLECC